MSNTDLSVRPDGAIYDLHPKPHVAETTSALRNLMTSDTTISRLPTVAERQRLNERRHDLQSLLSPASGSTAALERMGRAIGNMLGGWLNVRGLNGPEVISGWLLKLQELPAWAVVSACNDFAEGRATFEDDDGRTHRMSTEYAPSQATVWRVAREKMVDQVAERDLINRIMSARLAAPEIADGERERVGKLMANLAADMGVKRAKERAVDAERARRESEAAAARRAEFKSAADKRRLARYAELGLRPVYRADELCDADALPAAYRFSIHEPPPSEAESILEER